MLRGLVECSAGGLVGPGFGAGSIATLVTWCVLRPIDLEVDVLKSSFFGNLISELFVFFLCCHVPS